MEPVGQVLGVYIVCHSEKGMYLMDQHAAAESSAKIWLCGRY